MIINSNNSNSNNNNEHVLLLLLMIMIVITMIILIMMITIIILIIRSISEMSQCLFGPRPWHIEIRHRVKKTSTIDLFGFKTLKLKIRRLKLWKPTVLVTMQPNEN